MFQAHVPAGRHMLVLHYWPTTFTIAIALAGGRGAGLLFALFVPRLAGQAGQEAKRSTMGTRQRSG